MKDKAFLLGYSEQENAHFLIRQMQNYIHFQGLPSEESLQKAACTSGASQNTM